MSKAERVNCGPLIICAIALFMAGCTSTGGGNYPEPIPGSITYGGQPRSKLTKAPVGSWFHHRFNDQYGRSVQETYFIQPDRSLLLTNRIVLEDVFHD